LYQQVTPKDLPVQAIPSGAAVKNSLSISAVVNTKAIRKNPKNNNNY
jgi:hypothetical protein